MKNAMIQNQESWVAFIGKVNLHKTAESWTFKILLVILQ